MGSHKAEVASKISGDQLINWTKSVPSRFHATAADEQSAESDSSRSAPLISTSLAANSGCGDYLDISEAQQSQESRKETQLDGETKGTATVTPAKVFSEAQNQVVPTPSRSQLVGDKSNDTEDTVADEELQYDSDFVVEEKEEDDTNLPQLSVRKQPEDFATQLQTIIELIRSGEAEPKTSGKVPRVIEIKDEEVQCLKELSDKDTQYSPGARLAESSGTVGQKKLLTKFNAVMESFESQQISLATKSAQTDGLADRTAKGAQTEAQSVSLAKEFLDRASSTANTSDQHSFAISTDSSSSQSLSSGEISLNRLKGEFINYDDIGVGNSFVFS